MLQRCRVLFAVYRHVIFAGALAIACAQVSRGQELARSVQVTEENDYFNFWLPPHQRSDDNYTQGVRISWDVAHVPSIAGRSLCHERAACGASIELGQDMYTPDDHFESPAPGERPYAGWLYARASAVEATEQMRRSLGAVVGLTGSPSLAAQTQEAFHHLVPGFRRPVGWEYQLPTEAAVALVAEETWHVAGARAGRWIDLEPETHASIGTLRTALGIGGKARLGFGLTHPWLIDKSARSWEGYLFLGGDAEVVAHDLFLDGSTFVRSIRVDRTPFVSGLERGIAIRFRRVGIEYRAVTKSREYSTGPATHSFGGISLRWWNAL